MRCWRCAEYKDELHEMREVIRAQGEFIQKLKREIRDFTTTDAQRDFSGGRSIADRGLRRSGG